MKVSLLTDAPKHNLALMKISAWHRANGDQVTLNMPLWKGDLAYASILFDWNRDLFHADIFGGPGFVGNECPFEGRVLRGVGGITQSENIAPDYSLYNLDYSLGYTFAPCFRRCEFCKVWKMDYPDMAHHSIWDFHDSAFKKICLLNNNTFFDPKWKETFEEIWDANLTVVDENGYDLRLLDDEKADALHRTRFSTGIHFAWDRMEDEGDIIRGLELLPKHHLLGHSNEVYVLIGFDTTGEEDLHRCQVIHDYGLTPYPMPYVKTAYTASFKRFINLHYYRGYPTIKEAWKNYKNV